MPPKNKNKNKDASEKQEDVEVKAENAVVENQEEPGKYIPWFN